MALRASRAATVGCGRPQSIASKTSRRPKRSRLRQCLPNSVTAKWQVANSFPDSVRDRIGDCAGRRTLAGLARAQERQTRTIDQVNFDAVGHLRKSHNRIGGPINAADARVVETNTFIKCPASRLQDGPFDLVYQAVGIDHLPAIDGGHRPREPRAT